MYRVMFYNFTAAIKAVTLCANLKLQMLTSIDFFTKCKNPRGIICTGVRIASSPLPPHHQHLLNIMLVHNDCLFTGFRIIQSYENNVIVSICLHAVDFTE